MLLFNNLLSW